ncbi:MAG: hypothetical protein ACXWJB_09720 [Limisphaerales bacterium]
MDFEKNHFLTSFSLFKLGHPSNYAEQRQNYSVADLIFVSAISSERDHVDIGFFEMNSRPFDNAQKRSEVTVNAYL